MNILKYAALGLVVAVLASCGGGSSGTASGGNSSGTTGGGTEISIALSPTSVSEALVQGISLDLRVSATANVQPGATISGTVYVLIMDDKGVIDPTASSVGGHGTNFSAMLVTNPKLSVGEHKGSIVIEACGDPACKTLYGSTSLAYDFEMSAATRLKPLTALAGVSDWQPINGNPGRTAYVPVTLDASVFSPRWLFTAPTAQAMATQSDFLGAGADATNSASTVTTDAANNLIVFADGPYLIALQGTDGSKVWSKNVDPHGYGNPQSPAIANGVVYTSQGLIDPSMLHGAELSTYDETTGAAGFTSEYSPNLCSGCGTAPVTVVGTEAFLDVGDNVFAFDAGTGAELWSGPNGVDGGDIALDSQNVYYVDDNFDGLVALDQPTGTQQYSVPNASAGAAGEGLVSLDGAGGAVALAGGQLVHVDLSTQTVDWKTPSLPAYSIVTSNAISDDTLYISIIDSSDFEASVVAYSTTNGHKLWTWTAPPADGATEVLSLIATKNLLFVSTDQQTYAVDVKTQAVVWSYPLGGGLSISPAGILYIQSGVFVAAVSLD